MVEQGAPYNSVPRPLVAVGSTVCWQSPEDKSLTISVAKIDHHIGTNHDATAQAFAAVHDLIEALEHCMEELYQYHVQHHGNCPGDYPYRCSTRFPLWLAKQALEKARVNIPGSWPEIVKPPEVTNVNG